MVSCAIPNCKSRYTNAASSLKFHSLPRDEKRKNEWIKFSKRSNFKPSGRYYFCELHFDENQYELNRKDKLRKLKPNGVPTILFPSSTEPRRAKRVLDSSDSSNNKNKNIAEPRKGNTKLASTSTSQIALKTPSVNIETDDFQSEIAKLRTENDQLRNTVIKMQLVLERRKANEINYLNENERLRKENSQLRTENADLKKKCYTFHQL